MIVSATGVGTANVELERSTVLGVNFAAWAGGDKAKAVFMLATVVLG